MTHQRFTKPIPVSPNTVIGAKQAAPVPFEPAGIDHSVLSERRVSDPTYGQNQVPNAIVNSCSQCCMETINGKPNLLGRLHRKMVKSCSRCPVGKAGDLIQARDGNGNRLFIQDPDSTFRPLTQTELMLMETDGTA